MFEKTFDDGEVVKIDNGVIALYAENGNQIANSNVDYYFDERGYDLETEEEVAKKYHEQFTKSSTRVTD